MNLHKSIREKYVRLFCYFIIANLVVDNSSETLHLSSLEYHVARRGRDHVVVGVLSSKDCVATTNTALHRLLSTLTEVKCYVTSARTMKTKI